MLHLCVPTPDQPAVTRRGFTLIELLVVIAIIALLIGILVPALSGGRRAGEQAVCLSNLRQVGQVSMLYAADNRGFSPALGVPWGRAPFWAIVVQQSMSDGETSSEVYSEDSVLVCPSANRRYGPGLTRTYAVNVTGHAGEPGDRDNFDSGRAHIQTWSITRASDTPWAFDSAMTAIQGDGPPPTRTISTLDFRNPEHVEQRLGWQHGPEKPGNSGDRQRFDAVQFDGSAKPWTETGAHWTSPLP